MSNLRVPFAVVGGALFSSVVFLALYQFVSVPFDVDTAKATVIEFTRQIVEQPHENKRDPKIERPPFCATARDTPPSSWRRAQSLN